MIEIEDRDFVDLLYQQWAKTTGAEDTYWMPEDDTDYYTDGGPGTWNVWAVLAPDDERRKDIDAVDGKKFVANFAHEADADFTTAIHGCFGDLVRRIHDALDEADRLDTELDERENEIAQLARENQDAWDRLEEHKALGASRTEEVMDLRSKVEYLEETMRKMDQDLIKAQSDLEYWKTEAHCYQWDKR